jgi:hypothetical protein
MEWNKYNFKNGDRVVLDKKYNNRSEVVVIGFTPNKMFATVQSDDGDKWQTMTIRLTPILNNETFKSE